MSIPSIPRFSILLRPQPHPSHLLRLRALQKPLVRHATTRAPETDKSRILEQPARFNPPSHGSRRVRPRMYPGPRLTDEEVERQKTKRYPNMMPPEGSFMHSFLTDRRLHMWITLSTLTALAIYAWSLSFLHTTIYRDQLPSGRDFLSHPLTSLRRFTAVYKLHVAHESEQVAAKRRRKLEDVQKRKEFLREHGVEPGFLTGGWMDKFGTMEGDEMKAAAEAEAVRQREEREKVSLPSSSSSRVELDVQSPTAAFAADGLGAGKGEGEGEGEVPEQRKEKEKKKPKMWLGIW